MNPKTPENLHQDKTHENPNINKELPVNNETGTERKESEQNKSPEKYLQVELEQSLQNNPLPSSQPQNVQDPNSLPASAVDPVQQVKSMISAGYTPSIDLIQDVSNLIKTDNTDYSNLWFAVLLQKLIREYNNK